MMKPLKQILTIPYIFLGLITLFGLSLALETKQLELIEEVVKDFFIPRGNVTGMSLSIVQDGKTVLSKGYGKQDIENGIEATNITLFSIGSITKSFVATLVVKILSEKYPKDGEGVLDKPIVSLHPKFNFTLSDRYRTEQTSFRDILSHRTCLSENDVKLTFKVMKTVQEYNYRTRYQRESCGHRTKFIYNNALYALAGELIASFVGKSFHQLVREFMSEIGMKDSTTVDDQGSYEDLPNMSQAYYIKDGAVHKMNKTLLRRLAIAPGAGGILSTATDMGKYMEFHINKGKVGDKQIVSKEAMSWLNKSSIHETDELQRKSEHYGPTGVYGYGLGFFLALYSGYAFYGHGGYWPPYRSALHIYEHDGKHFGIYLATNGPGLMSGENALSHEAVIDVIFDIIRTGDYNRNVTRVVATENKEVATILNSTAKNDQTLNSTPGKFSQIKFESVIGMYGNDSAGDLIIKLDEEDSRFLQMNYGEWGIGRLLPIPLINDTDATKFLVEFKTDVEQDQYADSSLGLIPIVYIIFNPRGKEGSLHLYSKDNLDLIFLRDATLDTFPPIPWELSSCGPYYINDIVLMIFCLNLSCVINKMIVN